LLKSRKNGDGEKDNESSAKEEKDNTKKSKQNIVKSLIDPKKIKGTRISLEDKKDDDFENYNN
jgi:hypothetical protein